jgi:hypothetical protein
MIQESTRALVDAVAYVAGLIGRPWREGASGPDAYDCWNLVAEVQERLFDRQVPFSADLLAGGRGLREIIETIRAHDLQRRWLPVQRPAHGDMVLLYRGMFPSHIGIWLELGQGLTGILHCPEDGVCLETVAQARASYPRLAYHRCADVHLQNVQAADRTFLEHVTGAPFAVIVKDPLNPLERAEIRAMKPGQRVGDVLDGLEHPGDWWLCLNDLPLLRRHPETGIDEHDQRVAEGDILWVLPPLPLGGDRGSQVLATVLSIVVAIAAPFAATQLGFIQGTMGHKLATAGIALAGQALISSFVPPPPVVAPLANPEPTYSFGRFGNQLRPGSMIPRPYGTMRREPDFLAQPWAEYEQNEQLVHVLLALGTGNHELLEFGMDDTPVWTSDGGYTGAIADVVHEHLPPGATPTLFPTAIDLSAEVENIECPEPDPVDGDVEIGPFAALASGRRATELIFDFVFPRGLFESGSGAQPTSVTWKVEAQEIDDLGQPIGPVQLLDTITQTAATTTPQRLTKRYLVNRARYRASVTRTSASTVTGPGAQDQLVWAGLKAKRSDVDQYPDVTALAIRVRADATSTRNLSNWYTVTRSILPHVEVATGEIVEGPTEQIDAAVLDIARAEYGLQFTDAQIDLDQLRTLAVTWAARGDVCCTSLESDMTAWEALTTVLAAGRTRASMIGDMLTFMRDERRLAAPRLVTQADMVRGSFEVERRHYRRESPAAVNMIYRDRQGVMRSLLCPADADPLRAPDYRTQVMVDPEQVWREGNHMAAANNKRRRYPSFIMLAGGRVLVPGQKINVSHPRPEYGRPARVVALDGLTLDLSALHGLAQGEAGWLSLVQPDVMKWGPVRCVALDDAKVRIDSADLDNVLLGDADQSLYQLDFREWIITEADPIGPGTAGGGLEGHQAEPTRAVVGRDGQQELACLVVEVLPSMAGQVEVLAVEEADEVYDAELAELPPQEELIEPPADELLWESVVIRGDITDVPDPDPDTAAFIVSGPVVAGAAHYLVETSPGVGPQNWTRFIQSNDPVITDPLILIDQTLIRIAAVGPVLTGPWIVYRVDFSNAINGVTTAVFQYVDE